MELLALSDHDTVSGVSEALAAGERLGVRVVTAVEISAVDDGASAPRELHILGYNIDHTGPRLTERLAEFLADREQRTLRMAAAPAGSRASSSTNAEIQHADRRRAADRPPPPRRGGARPRPPTPRACRRRSIDDVGSLIRGLPDRGPPGLPPARDADRGGGGRRDPRGRRRGHLGAPLLGHLRPRRSARHDRPLPRARDGRRRGLLHHPHARADRAAGRALRRARPAAAPARPTSTAPRTASSRASSRSTPTASSPTSGRSRPGRARA